MTTESHTACVTICCCRHYYLWDSWDGRVLKVPDEWTEDLEKVEDVVDMILCSLYWVLQDVVKVLRD